MKNSLKKIYGAIPLKKQLFTIVRAVFNPSKSVYKHLHFVDDIKVEVPDAGSFMIRHYGYQIENEIFWKGIFNGWEKVSLSLWAELCVESNVIMDIGANTGVYALLAKTVRPTAQVYAFEPVERVFEKLEANVALNSFDIHCVRKAVSNFDGEATIYDKDNEHTYSVTVNLDTSTDKENSIPTTIQTIRLDTFITAEALPPTDLMKIDVETHEVEALQGFGEYLTRFQPSMVIEILNDEVAKGIEELIAEIDYEYYVIDEESGIKKVEGLRKSDYYNFLICKPEVSAKLKSLERFKAQYQEG